MSAWFVKGIIIKRMADDMKNQRPHDANCGECDMAEFAGISYEAAHAQVESDVQRRGPQAMSEPIMQFFAFEHLPEPLQAVSRSFAELARALVTTLPRNQDSGQIGAPGRTRTFDPRLRRPVLYPTELRARTSTLLTRAALGAPCRSCVGTDATASVPVYRRR